MRHIQVMAFAPLHAPEITMVPGTLETMQDIVGGLVEILDLSVHGQTFQLFVHEDAEPLGMPKNRLVQNRMMYGTFVIAKFSDGSFQSISDKEAMKVWRHLDDQVP